MELEFCHAAFGSPDYEGSLALREAILRVPLNMKNRPEDVANDHLQQHFVAKHNQAIIGTVTLVALTSTHGKLRQMAIADDMQGKGIGEALVRHVHRIAAQQGLTHLTLHARAHAAGFYEKLGYQKRGEVFEEIGIAHQAMETKLIA